MTPEDKVRILLDPRQSDVFARVSGIPLEDVLQVRRTHGWPNRYRTRTTIRVLLQDIQRNGSAKPTISCPLCGRSVAERRLRRHQGTRKCLEAVAMIAMNA